MRKSVTLNILSDHRRAEEVKQQGSATDSHPKGKRGKTLFPHPMQLNHEQHKPHRCDTTRQKTIANDHSMAALYFLALRLLC